MKYAIHVRLCLYTIMTLNPKTVNLFCVIRFYTKFYYIYIYYGLGLPQPFWIIVQARNTFRQVRDFERKRIDHDHRRIVY